MTATAYKPSEGAKRAGKQVAAVGGFGTIIAQAIMFARGAEWIPWDPSLDVQAAALMTAVVAAVWRFGMNWFRNK